MKKAAVDASTTKANNYPRHPALLSLALAKFRKATITFKSAHLYGTTRRRLNGF